MTPDGLPTVTVVSGLLESVKAPAPTKVIGVSGVAVEVGVGVTGTGVWVGVAVTVGVAVGTGGGVAVAVAVGKVPDGMSRTACPLITGEPIGVPLEGYLELAV